ncbi:MAG TPA: hypothetical protein HA282_02875 [Nanoarchaeota archaeon]|nr:hypothetical protein [Nanoarchaeota archaeon]HIH66136.1 hypothetical protein [Nanoarchaeota archaeon]
MDEKKEALKKELEFVKICPKCNSLDLKTDMRLVFLGDASTLTCKDCGYTNTFFPEVEAGKLKEFAKEFARR